MLVPQPVLQKATKPEEETSGSGDFIFPSQTLNTLDIAPSRTQNVFLSARQPGRFSPAPASVTFYTGHPVIDESAGLAFINSDTISRLANVITTVDLLSASGRVTESFGQKKSTSFASGSAFSTVMVEAETIRGLLVTLGLQPTSVEVEQEELDNSEEATVVRLKTSSEVLEIGPSPTYGNSASGSSQMTFTVRAVSNTASESSSTVEPQATPASTEAGKPESDTKTPENTENDETLSERGPVSKKPRTEYPPFEGKFPELADKFPEFSGLYDHSDRRHLKDIPPERWQAFLRARTRRLVGEPFPEGVEGKDHYHGFECGLGVPHVVCFRSATANPETSEEREQWLAIRKKREEAEEAYKRNNPMYLPIEHRRDPQKSAEARENRMKYQKEINNYKRQLIEMKRKPCQKCGFLMVQEFCLDFGYNIRVSWPRSTGEGCYLCAACYPDKLLKYHYTWPDTDGPDLTGETFYPLDRLAMLDRRINYRVREELSKRQAASDKNDEGEP